MLKPNTHYAELKDTYLFNTVYRKTNEYLAANPEKKVLRMGVGDVSLPLCDAVIKALHKAVDDQANAATFHGYMPEIGDASLRKAIENYYKKMGTTITENEIFVSSGACDDLGDILELFDTAFVFNREGARIAEYDKTHLFTPMGEHDHYTGGDHRCHFTLDGVKCSIIICYDVRFPELTRSLALSGLDMLFVVSQWPKERIFHLRTITTARAIENQMFVVCCNSCGTADKTVFGGNSAVIDPFGKTLALAGETEEIISAACDMQMLSEIRESIPVFRDRRPELYCTD